jgi:hypothetical protein
MFKTTAAIGLMALATATATHAQSQRPGLWEHRSTVQARSGEMAEQLAEMKKQMAALPPDQRQAMEQMVGMSVTSDGRSVTAKHCITPEEAANALIPSHDDECTYTITQRSASFIKARFVCADEGRTSGEGEYRFSGDTGYSGTFKVTTLVDGKPERMDMKQSGKWLSAQCGPYGAAGVVPKR